MNTRDCISIAALAIALAAWPAAAQTYEVEWFTIDGGGTAEAAGTTYTVRGTVGQPDAGTLSNATHIVTGGFWPVARQLEMCLETKDSA